MTATRARVVTGAGGVRLRVDEAGEPAGRPVLFVHGFSHSRLAWLKQLRDPSLRGLRLVAMDLRGHGESDKPREQSAYDAAAWAEDIRAAIAQLDLRRPILCGWSYGGIPICHYLSRFGADDIGGLALVGALTGRKADALDAPDSLTGYLSDDVEECVAALSDFVRGDVYREPSPETLAFFLGCNVIVPPYVRVAMLRHGADNRALLPTLRLPTLIVHGREDAVIPLRVGERHAEVIPGARLAIYDEVGHMPFWEAPERFNRELLEFAASV